MRPVYPYSVIPGGAYTAGELNRRLSADEPARRHYQGFDLERVRVVRAAAAQEVYVSYRRANAVYWTRHRVPLQAGELLLTDGTHAARARCGNRISADRQEPTADFEPPAEILDAPENWELASAPELPPVVSAPAPKAPQPPPVRPRTMLATKFLDGSRYADTGPWVLPPRVRPRPPVAAVPEPSSVVLLLTAAGALGGIRYWKARRRSD